MDEVFYRGACWRLKSMYETPSYLTCTKTRAIRTTDAPQFVNETEKNKDNPNQAHDKAIRRTKKRGLPFCY
jgi:hypothetical protein